MRRFFADTSFFIALINLDDPYHDSARVWHAYVRSHAIQLVTTTAVLVETADGFIVKGRWPLPQPVLSRVLTDPLIDVVTVDTALVDQAMVLKASRPDKAWQLTDCVSFAVMERRGIREALTADRHFSQASFRALLREAPDPV